MKKTELVGTRRLIYPRKKTMKMNIASEVTAIIATFFTIIKTKNLINKKKMIKYDKRKINNEIISG